MPVPPSFPSRRPADTPRPSSPKDVVLAIGARALLRSRGDRHGRVVLTDENGTASVGSLADGVEVVIQAWRPRRSAAALYHVRAPAAGEEGWVSASSLEALPRLRERPAPAPPPPAAASARSKSASPKRKR